jgi:predicted amidophosphoribosyltransferase
VRYVPANHHEANIRAADLRTPDHFPTCPSCGDYAEIGATICATCCAPLIDRSSREQLRR